MFTIEEGGVQVNLWKISDSLKLFSRPPFVKMSPARGIFPFQGLSVSLAARKKGPRPFLMNLNCHATKSRRRQYKKTEKKRLLIKRYKIKYLNKNMNADGDEYEYKITETSYKPASSQAGLRADGSGRKRSPGWGVASAATSPQSGARTLRILQENSIDFITGAGE